MYFYKKGKNWYLGVGKKTVPTGTYSIEELDSTHCNILPIQGSTLKSFSNVDVTTIVKDDLGNKYATYDELYDATEDFFLKTSTGGSGGDAATLQTHPASYFQEALGFTPEQAGVASTLITALKGSVGSEGDTLKKLYDLILSGYSEITLPTSTARNAYNITKLPTSVLVTDDGDGKWALYKATSTGVGATFIKLSDPDLLNAVMSASQIASAYEGIADVNRFTNALKQSVIDSASWIASHTVAILAHLADNVVHITGAERTTWNAKLTASKSAIETLLTGAISTHSHTVTKADVGLPLANNTADANKPVSTAQAAANTATLNSAKTYADTVGSSVASAASSDATSKANAALSSANEQSIINSLIF